MVGGRRGSGQGGGAAAPSRESQGDASLAGELSPSAALQHLPTSDPGLFPQHVHVRLHAPEGGAPQTLAVRTAGRAYHLLPPAAGPFPLSVGQTLKLGACSLNVEYLAGVATGSSAAARGAGGRAVPRPSPIPASALAEAACYICLEGPEGDGAEGADPLTNSLCQCAKPVHASCLHRWVTSRRSRECSICKSLLPMSWLRTVVSPPFAVLRVVRHVRGLRWGGQREYIVSFAQRGAATIGHQYDAASDVGLPDHSISRQHAQLACERGSDRVTVCDLHSATGTYLLLPPRCLWHLPLPQHSGSDRELVYTLKVERTVLTLRVQLGHSARPPWGTLASIAGRFRWMWGRSPPGGEGGGSSSSSSSNSSSGSGSSSGSTALSPPPKADPATASARIALLNAALWEGSGAAGGGSAAPGAAASGTSIPLPAPAAPAAPTAPALLAAGAALLPMGEEETEGEEEAGVVVVGGTLACAPPARAREAPVSVTIAAASAADAGAPQLVFVGGGMLPLPPARGLHSAAL